MKEMIVVYASISTRWGSRLHTLIHIEIYDLWIQKDMVRNRKCTIMYHYRETSSK